MVLEVFFASPTALSARTVERRLQDAGRGFRGIVGICRDLLNEGLLEEQGAGRSHVYRLSPGTTVEQIKFHGKR